ncbi:MAG: hypothetical protein GEV06_19840 [Luteitalea sp.]|nr:hypothetical protein [Luteitalea sp.]
MFARLVFKPFGSVLVDVRGGAGVEMPIELANGALYTLAFAAESVEEDGTIVCRLSAITNDMPPLTPEADPLKAGDNARMPMMDEFGYSATAEAEQRRKEWAARGVRY